MAGRPHILYRGVTALLAALVGAALGAEAARRIWPATAVSVSVSGVPSPARVAAGQQPQLRPKHHHMLVGTAPARPSPSQRGADRRHRIALMLVLLAAAMPIRTLAPNAIIRSLSILDILLLIAAVTLVLDCAVRPLNIGHPRLFALLCIPAIVCGISLVWSQDRAATLRATFIYFECIVAYLFVLRELDGASPTRMMIYIKRYSLLVIIPAILLLLHTPGFAPAQPDLDPTSGDYLSYYSRLSHPVLGRSNNLATVLAFFVPILFYWGHRSHDRRYTRAGFITLVAVILTLSRGVILALLVTALLAALGSIVRSRRIERQTLGKIAISASGVLVGVVLLQRFNPYTREFFSDRFSGSNITIRSDLAQRAIAKIADRPLLGYGGGVAPDQDPQLAIGVHNAYLQQILYFGLLPGLVVSLALIGTAFFFFSRQQISGVNRAIGFTLLIQLLIFITESSFEGTDLRLIFYLSVGLATALSRACEAESPSGQITST